MGKTLINEANHELIVKHIFLFLVKSRKHLFFFFLGDKVNDLQLVTIKDSFINPLNLVITLVFFCFS